MTPERRARGEAAVVVALFLLLQAIALLSPQLGVVDPEEGGTAVQAVVLGWSDPRDLFAWQVQKFCGGCSVAAVAYRPILAAFGDAVLGWKLVLVPFQLAWLVGGWRVADALGGAWARRAFQALALCPPWLVVGLSWRGWTNHFEATAIALLAASFLIPAAERTARPWVGGALVGLALLVGLSGAAVVVATALVVALERRRGELARAVVSSSWVVLPWAWAWHRSQANLLEVPVDGPTDVTVRAAALLDPERLGVAFGAPGIATAVPLLVAIGVGLLVLAHGHGRAWLPALGVATWTLAWVFGRFELDAVSLGVPRATMLHDGRYLVVPAMLGLLGVAVAAGWLVGLGRARAGGVLLALALVPGVVGRITLPEDGLTTDPLLHAHAPAWDWFRLVWLARAPQVPAWTCPAADVACAELSAYRADRSEARLAGPPDPAAPLDPVGAWADGRAALRLPLGPRTPPADPVLATAWAYGYGQTWGARRGTVDCPEGLARWIPVARDAFERGLADGHARPWWPRYRAFDPLQPIVTE